VVLLRLSSSFVPWVQRLIPVAAGLTVGRRPAGAAAMGSPVLGARRLGCRHAGSGCRTASPWAVAAAGGQQVTAHLAVVDAVAGDLPAVIDL